MWRKVSFALALGSCAMLTACGGGSMQTKTTSGIPMSLSIGDTPPNGVAVLFFEALITGVSLQPSDPNKQAVTVMSTPTEVEFGHLQTDRAFLNLANVNPDTYKSITLTFGNATLTIVNHSTGAIGSCAVNSVCELTPSFNPATAMLSGAPFPITISQNSVVGIRLDFNVNSSVQSDLSINPVVTIKNVIQRQDSDEDMEMERVDEVDGLVTAVSTNQFTLMNERTGQSFMISVDANTQFEDFGRTGCTANPVDISCVKMNQILNVELSENGTGAMLAKRVEFVEDASKASIKATITSVDSTTQFHAVVFNEEPAVNGVSEGSPVVVTIGSNAVFGIGPEELGEFGGFSIPGVSFAGGGDLLVGQDVQIRPVSATTSGGVTTITTDVVRLWPSQISGTVGTGGVSNGMFTLTGLSPLFTGATPPITSINVVTLSEMSFMDFQGSPAITAGSNISVKGLLFNIQGTPTLVTRTMRQDD